MVRYSLDIENKAKKQLADLYRSGNKADVKKVEVILPNWKYTQLKEQETPSNLNINYLDFGPAVSIKKIDYL